MKTEEPSTPAAPSQPSTPAPTQQPYATQWTTRTSFTFGPCSKLTKSSAATTTSHAVAILSIYFALPPGCICHPLSSLRPTGGHSIGNSNPNYYTKTTSDDNDAAVSNNSTMDTADIATLNDALGSAGVDLRAEEESLQRTHDSHQPYRAYEDRTRKQPPKPAFDTRILGTTMRNIGTSHKVTRIPEESVNYLALSLRARLQDLITAMIAAAHHRNDTQFDRPASLYEDGSPMWSIVVRSDVAKQLVALEKVEREEEMRMRKERKERAELTAAHAAALAAQANGMAGAQGMADTAMEESEGNVKKKRKKEGPGVTARNMSEDVRKKMSNAVATQAAGLGGKYSWMTAANAASTPPPKPKPAAAAAAPTPAAASSPAATATGTPAGGASSWARPYVSTKKPATTTSKDTPTDEDSRTVVTMRDAMFVIEKERGHGGGRGAARGWS
ncbi:unnamed protein product [Cyclocybe aegerita]|uniref:Transcription initiation factor TFIID subunit 4 n=1 Tax=Cyclocybe aegerita TaxID=1973307 RepID=A0A8S0W2A5_CYCAE|nr:unnamed protein product [Cyclocybe aegerita]